MKLSPLAAAALAASFASGYLVSPPGVAAPLTISTCSAWHLVVVADTCASVAAAGGLTLAQFVLYNPIVGSVSSCVLLTGFDFCTQINFGVTTTSAPVTSTTLVTSTTSTKATTTSAGNGISTPTPFQAGMTTSCNSFHLVVSGDECGTIASSAGISLDSFYAWNPAAGNTCSTLWAGYNVCVGVIGGVPSQTTATVAATAVAGNVIATPTPFESGMISSCKKFHLVVSGDGCWAIANAAGISLADFYTWNPTVGNSCGSLWLGYNVCIGV